MQHFDVPMIVRDVADGRFVWVNRLFTERLGWIAEDLVEKPLAHWIAVADRPSLETVLDAGHGNVRCRHLGQEADPVSLDWEIRTEKQNLVALGVLAGHGTSCAARAETVLPEGDTLAETLEALALIVEDQHPGRCCSILLLDEDRQRVRVGAGPSLPAEYNAAVEGLPIGPSVGSCGTAAYWGQRVLVENIQEEGLWRDLKQSAAMAGVAACWSHPITSRTGEVIGALALYNSVPSAPTPQELTGLEMAARMVALAIERGRAEQTLRESEAGAQFQAHLLTAVTDVVTSFVDKNDWGTAASRLVRAAMDLTESESGLLRVVEPKALPDEAEVCNEQQERLPYQDVICHGSVTFTEFEPILVEVALSASPVVSGDPAAKSGFLSQCPDAGSKLRNVLGSPIRVGGEVVAVLCVGNTAAQYDDRDVHAVSVLCRAASELFDAYRRQKREAALEAQLRQAQKLESIGVLAGGIAHDFNNILTAITGFSFLAKEATPANTRVRENLEEVLKASERAGDLVQQILAFSRHGKQEPRTFEIATVAKEALKLLRASLPATIEIREDLESDCGSILADPTQIHQVVMNLCTNAYQAMRRSGGGTLTVSLDPIEVDAVLAGELGGLQEGPYVRLTVSDTGAGIDSAIRERIFDPFFTTKEVDEGTGLGLSVVHGVVMSCGGAISVRSDPGKGTSFFVYLPQASSRPAEQREGVEPIPRGSEHILFVDDEEAIVQFGRQVLRKLGYRVTASTDSEEALCAFRAKPDSFDLVIADVTMPKMTGIELNGRLMEIRPALPVILTTGFSELISREEAKKKGFAEFLSKPFAVPDFAKAIRRVLDQTKGDN